MTVLGVNGSTRLLGVVGDPIAQVRAPGVWTALFQRNRVNCVCLPCHVAPAQLATFFAGVRSLRNLAGLIVTIPHKPAIVGLLDDVSERARQVGAANVVRFDQDGRSFGDILDGEGLVSGLRGAGQQINGRRALVVGSGGVGSAIAFALAHAGVTEVALSDIAEGRAASLAQRLNGAGYSGRVHGPDPASFDLIVNASPLGMRADDPLPFDCARLDSHAIVADVVIHDGLTPLLHAAQKRGCYVQPGTVMSDHQVPEMADFFDFGSGDWTPQAIAEITTRN
ncbi:MAG: shikimate dehydrogenase [Chloroflexi bacterium]|nr:shikimate dehydrogenase [Chloroflexota bacterium]MBV9597785.1 shikimate dehydrogenase [Chloroflexota bacterium]